MLKQTKNHTLYEVWSEDAAESVYVDHKPTTEEIEQLWTENWPNTSHMPQVFKEAHVYTDSQVKFGKNHKTGKVQVIKGNKVIGEQG